MKIKKVPVIYRDIEPILVELLKNMETGEFNEFYQELKKDKFETYSSSNYNIYYQEIIDSSSTRDNYTIINNSSDIEKILDFIDSNDFNKVCIVTNKRLYECMLYCKTVHQIVEIQCFTFNLGNNKFLCDIEILTDY